MTNSFTGITSITYNGYKITISELNNILKEYELLYSKKTKEQEQLLTHKS